MRYRNAFCGIWRRTAALVLAACLLLTGIPVFAVAAGRDPNGYIDLDAGAAGFRAGKTLIKEKDFTITTKRIDTYGNGYVTLELTIRNSGKKTLCFRDRSAAVDGVAVNTACYETVRPGKKVTATVSFDALPLAVAGVDLAKELNFCFDVVDDDSWDTLYENCSVTIPLGFSVDMDYYPCQECIYEEDSFSLTLLGSVQVEYRASPSLIFCLDNDLDGSLVARNEGELSVDDCEYDLYGTATADAYSPLIFTLASSDTFFEDISGTSAVMEFPLQICTGNLNPLVDTRISLRISRDGKILDVDTTAKTCEKYETYIGEYNRKKNMFMGTFHNYTPIPGYADTLRNKYPEDYNRYFEHMITPHIGELLTLYLDELEQKGYCFGVVERPDLCSEDAYVVELTEKGKSVIRVTFLIWDQDPKSAQAIVLECTSDDYRNTKKLNSYTQALWTMYYILNVEMTERKQDDLLKNSQTATSEEFGVMFRGEYDGLGYLFATGSDATSLLISADLSLAPFEGM